MLNTEVFLISWEGTIILFTASVAPGSFAFRGALQRGALPLLFASGKNLPCNGPAIDPPGDPDPLDSHARIRSLVMALRVLFSFLFFNRLIKI